MPPANGKFCRNCGIEVGDDIAHCGRCGSLLPKPVVRPKQSPLVMLAGILLAIPVLAMAIILVVVLFHVLLFVLAMLAIETPDIPFSAIFISIGVIGTAVAAIAIWSGVKWTNRRDNPRYIRKRSPVDTP